MESAWGLQGGAWHCLTWVAKKIPPANSLSRLNVASSTIKIKKTRFQFSKHTSVTNGDKKGSLQWVHKAKNYPFRRKATFSLPESVQIFCQFLVQLYLSSYNFKLSFIEFQLSSLIHAMLHTASSCHLNYN